MNAFPKIKILIKFRNECDLNFTNNYTHGGFFCGNNNFWPNQCVEGYCDLGFF